MNGAMLAFARKNVYLIIGVCLIFGGLALVQLPKMKQSGGFNSYPFGRAAAAEGLKLFFMNKYL